MAGEHPLETKKLKTGMMGYSKKDVYAYITELDKTYQAELAELKEENKELRQKLRVLETDNRELTKKSGYISDAIVKAEEYARELTEKAEKDAETQRRLLEADLLKEKRRVELYCSKAETLKEYIETMLQGFQEKLDRVEDKRPEA